LLCIIVIGAVTSAATDVATDVATGQSIDWGQVG
jgi:hypothetical protein